MSILVPDGLGQHRHLGARKRDRIDTRDALFSLPPSVKLPPKVDWRADAPKAKNQGQVGLCFAFMGCYTMEFETKALGEELNYSQQFLGYVTRELEAEEAKIPFDPKDDCGATIRGTFKTMAQIGVCGDTTWPYQLPDQPPEKRLSVTPPPDAFALARRGVSYEDISAFR